MKVDTQQYQNESDVKGKPKPVVGKYHVLITHAKDPTDKFFAVVLECEVLAGTVPGQEGKAVTVFLNMSDAGEETAEYCAKCSRWCMAAGLIGGGQAEREISATELEGCQVVIEVIEFKSKKMASGKDTGIGEFGLAVWSVDNPEVASVPKNLDAIRLWNEDRGRTASGNASGHHAAATVNTDDI
jgi:hypothetical protein